MEPKARGGNRDRQGLPRGAFTFLDVVRRLRSDREQVGESLDRVPAYLGHPEQDPNLKAQRFESLFAPEVKSIGQVERRLREDPQSVSEKDVTDALADARELVDIRLGRQLRQRYYGRWVAIRGDAVIESADTREELYRQLSGRQGRIDKVFRVINEDVEP